MHAITAAVGNLHTRKISLETANAIMEKLNAIIEATESQVVNAEKLVGVYKHRVRYLKRLQKRVWEYTTKRRED